MHVLADNVRESSVSIGTGDFFTTGGLGAVPTAVTGRLLSNVVSSGDTFDYVIHATDANEWEVGIGTYGIANTFSRTRVVSSSNGGSLVNFSAGNKVVWIGPSSEIQNYFANLYNIKTFGATPGGSNSTAIAAARIAAGVQEPIFIPATKGQAWGAKSSICDNVTTDVGGEGTGFSLIAGSAAAPYTSNKPLIYVESTVDATEATQINHHSGIDVRTRKLTGDKGTYTSFFALKDEGGVSTSMVTPIFSYMELDNVSTDPSSLSHGIQVYIDRKANTNNIITGIDILISNSGNDPGWHSFATEAGCINGLRYHTIGRGSIGHGISSADSGPGTGWYTGFLIDQNSIVPYSYANAAEALRIRGASIAANRYQGMWFQDGYLKQGINLVGPTYENGCAVLVGKDTRTVYGTANSDVTYTAWTSGNLFNVQGGTLAVNGLQVAKERITGWTTPTGVSTRTGFSTSGATTANVAEALKALIEDLKTHGLIGT